MNQELRDNTIALWQQLVESHRAFSLASHAFLTQATNRVEVIRSALRGRERDTALRVAGSLQPEELRQLLPELVDLSRCAHGPFEPAWKILLALPRDWVVAHIEEETEPILRKEEEDDYWMFLQLFNRLDRDLTTKLARRAAAHSNPDIRELAEDYLAQPTS